MIKASLDFGLRPNFANGPDRGYLAIHCNGKGIKAIGFEFLKPWEDVTVSFFGSMQVIGYGLIHGVHKGDETIALAEVGTVIDEIFDGRKIGNVFWFLVEPVIFNLFNFERAVSGKF